MLEDLIIALIYGVCLGAPLVLASLIYWAYEKIKNFIESRKEIKNLIKDNRSKTFEQYVKGWDL